MGRRPSNESLSRADLVVICGGCACLLAGIAILALATSFAVTLTGICLLSLGAIAFVSLVFLLVGESEDRNYGRDVR